jgi:hypothetical protein
LAKTLESSVRKPGYLCMRIESGVLERHRFFVDWVIPLGGPVKQAPGPWGPLGALLGMQLAWMAPRSPRSTFPASASVRLQSY